MLMGINICVAPHGTREVTDAVESFSHSSLPRRRLDVDNLYTNNSTKRGRTPESLRLL